MDERCKSLSCIWLWRPNYGIDVHACAGADGQSLGTERHGPRESLLGT
jgi:hypothetical protein